MNPIPIRHLLRTRIGHDPWTEYRTESGELVTQLRPGDAYLGDDHRVGQYAYECGWSNCDGRHLHVLVPDGTSTHHTWNVDGRASNCTMKDDREHRCWVRHGAIGPELHVDKNGRTCAAGAGSIQIDGFLHHGHLVSV